jgi:hypothetical protein
LLQPVADRVLVQAEQPRDLLDRVIPLNLSPSVDWDTDRPFSNWSVHCIAAEREGNDVLVRQLDVIARSAAVYADVKRRVFLPIDTLDSHGGSPVLVLPRCFPAGVS